MFGKGIVGGILDLMTRSNFCDGEGKPDTGDRKATSHEPRAPSFRGSVFSSQFFCIYASNVICNIHGQFSEPEGFNVNSPECNSGKPNPQTSNPELGLNKPECCFKHRYQLPLALYCCDSLNSIN